MAAPGKGIHRVVQEYPLRKVARTFIVFTPFYRFIYQFLQVSISIELLIRIRYLRIFTVTWVFPRGAVFWERKRVNYALV